MVNFCDIDSMTLLLQNILRHRRNIFVCGEAMKWSKYLQRYLMARFEIDDAWQCIIDGEPFYGTMFVCTSLFQQHAKIVFVNEDGKKEFEFAHADEYVDFLLQTHPNLT